MITPVDCDKLYIMYIPRATTTKATRRHTFEKLYINKNKNLKNARKRKKQEKEKRNAKWRQKTENKK